jgi:uncharacterized protein YdaU (DUF1376 family)
MKRTDTWMPLDIGRYMADTLHLTTEQHGAYLLLLCAYWGAGPLPDDDGSLASIAKMPRKAWDSRARDTIRAFFHKGDDGKLHQKRADIEREKAQRISETRSQAGNNGASARWHGSKQTNGNGHGASIANAMANASQTDAPSPSQRKKDSPLTPRKRGEDEPDADFDRFWSLFPRKQEGPGAARGPWAKALKVAPPAEIIAGLQRYPFKLDFLPMAATWLNQKRWQTQPDTPPPAPPNGADPDNPDAGYSRFPRPVGLF